MSKTGKGASARMAALAKMETSAAKDPLVVPKAKFVRMAANDPSEVLPLLLDADVEVMVTNDQRNDMGKTLTVWWKPANAKAVFKILYDNWADDGSGSVGAVREFVYDGGHDANLVDLAKAAGAKL